jgi:hypothetical protein
MVDEIRRELYRSRRYGRPLTLIGVPGASDGIERLRHALRAIDRAWHVRGQFYILVPEGDADMGRALLSRLEEVEAGLLERRTALVATFPEDALTGDGLIEAVFVDHGAEAAAPSKPQADGDGHEISRWSRAGAMNRARKHA